MNTSFGLQLVTVLVIWQLEGAASVLARSCFSVDHGKACPHNSSEAPVALPSSSTFDAKEMFELLLAEDYNVMDPKILPQSIAALKKRGAHRCWHKHSTFLQHLVGVHNILRVWGQGPIIGRVGLFHSAYSNSYVNLALFDPKEEDDRELVRFLIGPRAEELVHLFCVVDRQEVVVNTLLKQGRIPEEGLTVPHIRNSSEQILLSPETLRLFLVFTMADSADQYFGWQDRLFGGGGYQGSMVIPGQDEVAKHESRSLWPGISRPGLWMSYLSQLGQVVRTFRREWRRPAEDEEHEESQILDIPPIFDNCTKLLSVDDEADAIDLYCSVSSSEDVGQGWEQETQKSIEKLQDCVAKNPWIFEPHVLLTQKFLHLNEFENAERAAQRALELQIQWGTPWDKRLSFGAWVAWTRVLFQRAKERKLWPANSWEVNNLGLVWS